MGFWNEIVSTYEAPPNAVSGFDTRYETAHLQENMKKRFVEAMLSMVHATHDASLYPRWGVKSAALFRSLLPPVDFPPFTHLS